ncbi:MAG: DUF3883 domain-containing protein [Lysobacterales bacterium]
MARYQGLEGQPDKIVGGGKWVVENERGHESCNFLPTPSGDAFGHFETIKGKIDRAVSIEKLGATKSADKIDHVDVVWVATNPNGEGRRVIGYYRDATIYRRRQKHERLPTKQHKLDQIDSYMVTAKAVNMRCLTLEERNIVLGRPPGWIGQTNWWFPEHSKHPDVPAFVAKIRALFASHDLAREINNGNRKKLSRSTDPDRNTLVEAAAIDMVTKHYLDKVVRSVEKDNRGWDLEIYEKGVSELGADPVYKVEVKGLSGTETVVGVTPNEYRRITEHVSGELPSYRIAAVTSALSAPKLRIFAYDQTQKVWGR